MGVYEPPLPTGSGTGRKQYQQCRNFAEDKVKSFSTTLLATVTFRDGADLCRVFLVR